MGFPVEAFAEKFFYSGGITTDVSGNHERIRDFDGNWNLPALEKLKRDFEKMQSGGFSIMADFNSYSFNWKATPVFEGRVRIRMNVRCEPDCGRGEICAYYSDPEHTATPEESRFEKEEITNICSSLQDVEGPKCRDTQITFKNPASMRAALEKGVANLIEVAKNNE